MNALPFRSLAVAWLLVLTLAGSRAMATPVLYGSTGAGDGPSSLYRIDPTTGASTLVGPIGFNGVNSIDFHPLTGILYGIANNRNALITIDTTTGAGTRIAGFTRVSQSPDMSFSPNGTLYTWSEGSPDNLNTVNLVTGVATEVGFNGIGSFTAQTGLDVDSHGTIYLKNGNGNIYTVSPVTGRVTFLIDIDPGNRFDNVLAFDPNDRLYTVDRYAGNSDLYTIDLVTGTTTRIGATGLPKLSALAFVPSRAVADGQSGTLVLSGLGVMFLAALRRRRSWNGE